MLFYPPEHIRDRDCFAGVWGVQAKPEMKQWIAVNADDRS